MLADKRDVDGAYPGFCSMKRLGVVLLPLDGMLVHRRVNKSIKFAGSHLYIHEHLRAEKQGESTMS